jgi:hypothetical protein
VIPTSSPLPTRSPSPSWQPHKARRNLLTVKVNTMDNDKEKATRKESSRTIIVETVEEDEDDDNDEQHQQLPPATPKEPGKNYLQTHTVFMEPISEPLIQVKATRKRSSRDNESEEQRKKRLERDRLNKQKRRRDASDEASNKRHTADNERKRHSLANATDEISNQRRTADNERKRSSLANATDEISNERRTRENERKQHSRINASDEVSNERRTADSVRKRLAHATETPDDTIRRQEGNNKSMHRAREQERDTVQSKVVDFSTLEMVQDSNFHAFEQNPEVAAMLWHVNSGFYRFNGIENLTEDDPDLKQKVIDEVLAEKLSNVEKEALINDYLYAMGDVVVTTVQHMTLHHTARNVAEVQKKEGMLQY